MKTAIPSLKMQNANLFSPFSYQKNIILAKVLYSPKHKKNAINNTKQLKKSASAFNFSQNSNLHILMRKYMIDYQKMRKINQDPYYSKELIVNQDEFNQIKMSILNKKEYSVIDFSDINISPEFNKFIDDSSSNLKGKKNFNDYDSRLERFNSLRLPINKDNESNKRSRELKSSKVTISNENKDDDKEEYLNDFLDNNYDNEELSQKEDDSQLINKKNSNILFREKIKLSKTESFDDI